MRMRYAASRSWQWADTDAGREQVEACLTVDTELLVLDSISTLCPGVGPENDADPWEPMQSWLLELRRRGVATLLVHHDGKGGSQRGTSKREDVLSQVVQLKRPSDYRPREGARFELHYTKSRGLVGDAVDPLDVSLTTGEDGSLVWTFKPLEDVVGIKARQLADEGLPQRQIASELGIGLGTVNRALKRAKP